MRFPNVLIGKMEDRNNRSRVGANSHVLTVLLSTIVKHCQYIITNHTHYRIILNVEFISSLQSQLNLVIFTSSPGREPDLQQKILHSCFHWFSTIYVN